MITINNFKRGQSTSPYTSDGAFAKCLNLDVTSQPGIARINYLPVLAGAPAALMTSYATNTDGSRYVAGGGYIYQVTTTPALVNITGTGATSCAANSVGYWEGYLIGLETARLRYTNTGVDPTTWASFAAPGTAMSAPTQIFVSEWDGNFYVANGQNIARLSKVGATFDPTNNATWLFTATAFTLPYGYKSVGISEIDNFIVISAYKAGSGSGVPLGKTVFFFWNRADTTSEYIFELDEPNVMNLFKLGRQVIATGGKRGNFYKVSLYGVTPWKRIPFDWDNAEEMKTFTTNATGDSSVCNGMAWWNNNLMVGVGNNANAGGTFNCGIYSLGDSVNHAHTISSGKTGSDTLVQIGTIFTSTDSLIYSWKTTTSAPVTAYGVDVVKFSNNRNTTYTSNFETLFYPVGLYNEKKSFDHIEVQLARPLQTGEGVRVYYRTNINTAWASSTLLGTCDYATNGAVSSLWFPGIHNVENLQLKIELTTGATSKNTPYLKEIHLI